MPARYKLIMWLSVIGLISLMIWADVMVKIAGPTDALEPLDRQDVRQVAAVPFEAGTSRPARPIGNPGNWLGTADYPASALRGEKEGLVRFTLAIDPFGEVAECRITESSGVRQFDDRACAALRTRARFHPALDADGQPVAGTFNSAVRWEIAD